MSSDRATALRGDLALGDVLNGACRSGRLREGPFDLTPFNATAAYLTEHIPGYGFDPTMVGSDLALCPVDHAGNLTE